MSDQNQSYNEGIEAAVAEIAATGEQMKLTKTPVLAHYSKVPVLIVRSSRQHETPGAKPQGLWLSVEGNGDGWKNWCESEQYRLDRLAVRHDVVLAKNASILRISSARGIDALTKRFGVKRGSLRSDIDWQAVANKYDGILIAPYIWCRRLDDAGWYYTWDCASACIWCRRAIASITPAAIRARGSK